MSAIKPPKKLSIGLTQEQGLRLAALGKWKRRSICQKLRDALDGILTDLEIKPDEKPKR